MARDKNMNITDGLEELLTGRSEQETKEDAKSYYLAPKKAEKSEGKKKKKAYMQLNIFGYEDYLYRMSQVQKMTMTKYIQNLIEADMKANEKAYDGLKQIEALNKPPRVAKNTKKIDK